MTVEIVIDSRARVRGVSREVEKAIADAFSYPNPARTKALRIGIRGAEYMPETLRTWKRSRDEVSVPRGCVPRLVDVLTTCGELVSIVDRTVEGTPLSKKIPKSKLTLRDDQAQAVATMLRERSGLIRSPEGSGKTSIGLAAVADVGLRALVVVWTKQLASDWADRACFELGLSSFDIGRWYGGKHTVGLVTIATVQSLPSLLETHANDFGFVLVDEAQRYAAPSYFDAIDRIPAAYRLGMSADERRSDEKHFLTWDLFGPILEEIDRDDLIDDGAILDVAIYGVPTSFAEPQWLSDAREAGRKMRALQENREPVPFDIRQRASETLSSHGRLIADMSQDPERERLVEEVARHAHAKHGSVLVLTHRREHVQALLDRLRDLKAVSLMAGPELASNLLALRAGDATVAVGTYHAVGVGIDLPALASGVFATSVHQNRMQFSQFRGRFSRTGKREAAVYVLWDRDVYGNVPIRNFIKWCRTVRVLERDDFTNAIDARSFLKKA